MEEANTEITTSHPTSVNLSFENSSVFVAKMDQNTLSQNYLALNDLIKGSDTRYTVDTHASNSDRLIGMIDDIAITTQGEMYILDTRQFTVHQFDSSGNYQGKIGRQGNGPGEFVNPQKIMIHADSLLLVSDATKIEIFNISSEAEFVKTVRIDSGVSSMCSIDEMFYTFSNLFLHHNIDPETGEVDLIHAYDMNNFEHVHSFGYPYESSHPDIVQRLSEGHIVCNEESNTVSFLYQFVPVLKIYSAESGELEWSIQFDDLHLPNVSTSLHDGRVRFSYSRNENINDNFFEPLTLKGEYILLQLRRSYEEDDIEEHYVSYIIDSQNGTGEFVSNEIPHIISYEAPHFAVRDLYTSYFPVAKMLIENK